MEHLAIRSSNQGIPQEILDAFATNATGIPANITPQYVAESIDSSTKAGLVFILILTIVVFCFRVYARIFHIKSFGIDDWLAGASLVFYAIMSALAINIVDIGAARHNEYVQYIMTNDNLNSAEKLDFSDHIIYGTALFLCRMSGLAFYYRLCDRNPRLMVTVKFAAVFLVVGYIPQMALLIFHCSPVTALWPLPWQPNFHDYKCMSFEMIYALNSSISIACDLVLFIIPVLIIVVLKTNNKTKLALCAVLFPGVLVIIISSIRLFFVIDSSNPSVDTSYLFGPQLVVESAEVGFTIIALSIPGLKPLFQRWVSVFSLHLGSSAPSRVTRNDNSNQRTGEHALDCYPRAPSDGSHPLGSGYGHRASDDSLLKDGVAVMDIEKGRGSDGIEVTATIMQKRDVLKKDIRRI